MGTAEGRGDNGDVRREGNKSYINRCWLLAIGFWQRQLKEKS